MDDFPSSCCMEESVDLLSSHFFEERLPNFLSGLSNLLASLNDVDNFSQHREESLDIPYRWKHHFQQ